MSEPKTKTPAKLTGTLAGYRESHNGGTVAVEVEIAVPSDDGLRGRTIAVEGVPLRAEGIADAEARGRLGLSIANGESYILTLRGIARADRKPTGEVDDHGSSVYSVSDLQRLRALNARRQGAPVRIAFEVMA